MKTQARWVFVLVGNDRTGKTSFQKQLVKLIANSDRDYRLDCNLSFLIMHPLFIRKIETISIGNRSIQEKMPDTYKSIDDYFSNHFKDADICVISTHLALGDAQNIIANCHRKFYNVCAVFFSNSIEQHPQENADLSGLNWDDRLQVSNPYADEESQQQTQLHASADSFVDVLVERIRAW
jgi:hypothetical protein